MPSDLGRPIQDLELSYRPVELRSLMTESISLGRAVTLREIQWDALALEPQFFDVQVAR